MKALMCGSFDPWHAGHQYIYDTACEMFGKGNVYIGVGQNSSKKVDSNFIAWTLASVSKNVIPYHGLTVALCRQHDIDVIVRGIRNTAASINEEMELAEWNHRLEGIKTIFVPVMLNSHLSSSVVRDLYKHIGSDMFSTVFELLETEMPIRRWMQKEIPQKTIYFGKSCSGKTTILSRNPPEEIIDVDVEFGGALIKAFGEEQAGIYRTKMREYFEEGKLANFIELERQIAEKIDWADLLKIESHFHGIVDFACLGSYFKYISREVIAKFMLVKIEAQHETRKKYARMRGKSEGWLKKIDYFYIDPPFHDRIIYNG